MRQHPGLTLWVVSATPPAALTASLHRRVPPSWGVELDDDTLAQALREVRASHEQLLSAQNRLLDIRDTYRRERDEAIRYAVSVGGAKAKKDICHIIDASPQWLNKLLRGEAYRRNTD